MTDSELRAVVHDYRSRYGDVSLRELAYYRDQPSDEDAVSEAALSRVDGKRLSHQRRIPGRVLAEAQRRLLDDLDGLRQTDSFDDLYDRIEAIIRPIPGIGELAVYDIALRIGARFGKEPSAVYLHAGTRAGARALHIDAHAGSVPMSVLPRELQVLTAREAEDVLCIYKPVFHQGFSPTRVARCGSQRLKPRPCA